MSPRLLVRFFKEAGTLMPKKLPKAVNPKNIKTVQRPPSVSGNITSATMSKQVLTKSKTDPLPGTP